ncbi:MAG: histidinol-phosphate transaminase [Proteobacteria bacterium]|nr:histidinol-phosphate transaminase [Pseudomonadota bacterium]
MNDRGDVGWIAGLARPDILALAACEQDEWDPTLARLHANELPWRGADDDTLAGLNRYPQPWSRELERRLAALYQVPADCVLAGRGSDDAIDLLVRGFCRAGQDAVLVCPPTFSMYAMAARIQGAQVCAAPLRAQAGFALDRAAVLHACTPAVKLLFLCSPNNPTGNLVPEADLLFLAEALIGRALIVVDEAYVEFAARASIARLLTRYPQLVVLRTLSKAFGLAGTRCGVLLAHPRIVALLRNVLPPYAIGQHTIETVLRRLQPGPLAQARTQVQRLLTARAALARALAALPRVRAVYPSEANFLLLRLADAGAALALAREHGLLVRDARGFPGLSQCLRVTVGSADDNSRLLAAWA